ncbi:MAG: tryptophan-rich sensory protein [Candidatus Bathyarchaeota archaeon]|nr:tryptophan-rich sensory protein [Candidatus Bathyarchaeota archaeon]
MAFIIMVTVNGLAGSTTFIGGRNTAQISDANPTLITPAGYVFSIWGVIYLLLGIFVVFQALPSQQGKDFQKKISWFFVISSTLNICWLFLWQFQQLSFSVVLMFLLLASLIMIYLRLGINKSKAALNEKLAVHLPFSIYLGWITIASIANVAVAAVSVNWDGFGIAAETWATLVIATALLITLLVVFTRKDVIYGLVIIWALIGISVKQSGNAMIVTLTQSCAVAVAISVAATLLVMLKRR